MPDIYASIATVEESIQDKLGEVLELRGADAQQTAMREAYLSMLDLPGDARVLEVGCGTGVVCRHLAEREEIASVTGLDPSPVFVARAEALSAGMAGLAFHTGDARDLPFEDAAFDAVVFHTTLCHIPSPQDALTEAMRVLRPGGFLVVFDGDYASATVAIDSHDPLQAVVEKMVSGFVENTWLIRQLPKLLGSLGLTVTAYRNFAYSAMSDPAYMMTLVDRGIELMVASGTLGGQQGEALMSEARRRVDEAEFFGSINYISVFAQKGVQAGAAFG